MSLTGCSGRIKASTQAAVPSATPSTTPDNFYDDSTDPLLDNRNSLSTPTVPTGTPNAQAGTFKVDQDLANSWQARGIAVAGGFIYVSASDSSGLMKKGTVIKMNATDGKKWDNLASALLGLRHPMDSTVQGLAISGGTILAADSASKMYTVDATEGDVKTIKAAGGTDVAAGPSGFFVANGMVERSDLSGSSRTPLGNLPASGGIGADNMGNVYAVSGNSIKKGDTSGQVFDVVTTDLAAPLDVAVDNRNGDLYVLEQTMIKRFTTNGQLIVSFANGASKAVAIAVDETGSVYVADAGTTYKDSKVIKFSASIDNMNAASNNSSYGTNNAYGYGNSTGNNYSSYTNTRR